MRVVQTVRIVLHFRINASFHWWPTAPAAGRSGSKRSTQTTVPVGELAFTGSGDTLVRLGAVLAIGGVAAVASAAAARQHRED